jgi:hypothetical protein
MSDPILFYENDLGQFVSTGVRLSQLPGAETPPPVRRPYCLRCEVPIYEDEGVWRREATGSDVCPRNPARDGHEPIRSEL